MTFETAISILTAIKPARCEQDRYRQRDKLQHMIVLHLPVDARDRFERAMNKHFRL